MLPDAYAASRELYENDQAAKIPAVRDIYRRYWERCRQSDAMDFDDLLYWTVRLFRECPDALHHYQQRYRYLLVDEYQDTNYAQFKFVSLLASRYENSVRGWR